ncbi:MAG: helix-turn-helix transcriptional regulator [Lachnospiraceae bacterium]|nr:helix-turn-helix transcriptional regulator [Lachnospiraceae bacterium]
MGFGESLQALRKEAKVTQEQLANFLGVSAQAVSKWENGSYPEGDLIPRIADYFNVSIDFLYGREGRRASVEQEIVNTLSAMWREDGDYNEKQKKYIDRIHRLLWAMQVASWRNSTEFFERPPMEEGAARTASAVSFDAGFTFMRLDRNKDMYIFLRQPEDDQGFERWFFDTVAIREFFGKLSDQDNLKVLGYLYTLKSGEFASIPTIAKATGVPKDKIAEMLDYMQHNVGADSQAPVFAVQLVGADNANQEVYGVHPTLGGLFTGIFALTDSYLNPPQGYTMQTSSRTKSWADRSKLRECK